MSLDTLAQVLCCRAGGKFRSPVAKARNKNPAGFYSNGVANTHKEEIDKCYVCWERLERGQGRDMNGTCYNCIHSGLLDRDPITRIAYARCEWCKAIVTEKNQHKHNPACKLKTPVDCLFFAYIVDYLYDCK